MPVCCRTTAVTAKRKFTKDTAISFHDALTFKRTIVNLCTMCHAVVKEGLFSFQHNVNRTKAKRGLLFVPHGHVHLHVLRHLLCKTRICTWLYDQTEKVIQHHKKLQEINFSHYWIKTCCQYDARCIHFVSFSGCFRRRQTSQNQVSFKLSVFLHTALVLWRRNVLHLFPSLSYFPSSQWM